MRWLAACVASMAGCAPARVVPAPPPPPVITAAAAPRASAPAPPPCAAARPGPWRPGPRRFAPDGATLASADGADVVLFDARTWSPRGRLDGVPATVRALVYSPDGRWIAVVAGEDGADAWSVLLYDAASRTRVASFTVAGDGAAEPPLAFAPDGSWLAWPRRVAVDGGEAHEEIVIEGIDPLREIGAIPAPPDSDGPAVFQLVASTDGASLAIQWLAPAVSLVRARSGHLVGTWSALGSGAPVFSPGGHYFAFTTPAGSALIDLRSGAERDLVDHACEGVPALLFTADDAHVAVGGGTQVVCIFQTRSGRVERRLPATPPKRPAFEDDGIVEPTAWLKHDRVLLVSSAFGAPTLWDLATKHGAPVESARVLGHQVRPDGSIALSDALGLPAGNIDGDGQTSMLPSQDATEGMVVGQSKDAGWVAFASGDRVSVISTLDGSVRARFVSAGPASGLAFDPRSRVVYTTFDALYVWDAATGAPLLAPPPCTGCACR